ncbi:MAG: hypothetical protein NT018_00875 [Armatimonadetes bacterium]|nr:hypothetical protein [Armatimonadota bacterium]
MQITLSSSARNKLEQILDYLYTRCDLEELKPDELIDAMINHSLDLISTDDRPLIDCRDRLIECCGLKVGIHVGADVKFDESEEYRG